MHVMHAQYAPHMATPRTSPATPHAGPQDHWHRWQHLADELEPLLMSPHACLDFSGQLKHASDRLRSLVLQDPDVAIFHLVFATTDKVRRYSVLHAMHTGMLLTLIGLRKDWGEARTALAIQAGLTMNLSIMALQVELAQQQGPLNDEQRDLVNEHPLRSRQMLQALGVTQADWLQAVAEHHEQADGKGYPLGLNQAHPLADAIHTCDIFGAKLSPRQGRESLLSPRAAAEIFRQRSVGYFGATIIRELGLYPPGRWHAAARTRAQPHPAGFRPAHRRRHAGPALGHHFPPGRCPVPDVRVARALKAACHSLVTKPWQLRLILLRDEPLDVCAQFF